MSLDFSLMETKPTEVFERNITHNLNKMASEAGIYKALWRPDENGYKLAKDIIPVLEAGLRKLRENPEYYKQFNPDNGWGSYEGLLFFTKSVLDACIDHPEAEIKVWA